MRVMRTKISGVCKLQDELKLSEKSVFSFKTWNALWSTFIFKQLQNYMLSAITVSKVWRHIRSAKKENGIFTAHKIHFIPHPYIYRKHVNPTELKANLFKKKKSQWHLFVIMCVRDCPFTVYFNKWTHAALSTAYFSEDWGSTVSVFTLRSLMIHSLHLH